MSNNNPHQGLVPLARALYKQQMSGPEIEENSFATIDREAGEHGFPRDQWQVLRRMIHTTADFSIAAETTFTEGAIASGMAALRAGMPIYTDSNMIRSGLSLARLQSVSSGYGPESLRCHVADAKVAKAAQEANLPRAIFAVRKAAPVLSGAIVAFGNSPTGLMELSRMIIEEGLRPGLVIGFPVGFVNVVESKEELLALNVPAIVLRGRRGGSPLAVSAIHALCNLCLVSVRKRSPPGQ